MNIVESEIIDQDSYDHFLNQIKTDIQQARLRAAAHLTHELMNHYWRIGKGLVEKINLEGWGAKTIDRISRDITASFSNTNSYSRRNLYSMKQFAEEYPDGICETAASQLPWGHNIILLQKLTDITTRLWYAQETIKNGWSRATLLHWIKAELHRRHGKALTNFKTTLPKFQSELAEQMLKDPYNLSFVPVGEKYDEDELEKGIVDHIQKFLMELGKGFAFVGRQYPLEVSNKTFLIDLLFFHLQLRCYYVVELKTGEFDPRDVGQMSLYLSAVDDLLRHPQDGPTIGIILCKTKDKIVAEYTIRNLVRPMGVVSYETANTKSLPDSLRGSLPSVEEIEDELSKKTTLLLEATKE